jgi:hypothetical protein
MYPEIPIQRSVLDCLGKMFGFEIFISFQVGNGAGDFENPNKWLRSMVRLVARGE